MERSTLDLWVGMFVIVGFVALTILALKVGNMGTIGGTQVIVSSGATYNFFESGALGQDIFVQDIISEISAG